jgi:hypothetical protein
MRTASVVKAVDDRQSLNRGHGRAAGGRAANMVPRADFGDTHSGA